MKKLLAILVSMLMLCTMIPFATVSAYDQPTIVISCEEEEVNAGDEIEVTVNIEGLADTVGLTGAQIEIGFDAEVFELLTYFDEDEEMWLPRIEVGSKYNASSNKYIKFAPIDEETGFSERCLVQYMRAIATTTQVRREAHFYTATFKVKDDAASGSYELYVKNYNPKNIVSYGNVATDCAIENYTVTVNGRDPEPPHTCNFVGVETKAPTCSEPGIMTYSCECGKGTYTEEIPASCSYSAVYTAAKEATCAENGNAEYWYCANCDMYYADQACTIVTNAKNLVVPSLPHAYDDEFDTECNNCGDIRVIKYEVKSFGGNSISENVSGLAFRFDLSDKISGLSIYPGTKYVAVYDDAKVTPDSTGTYKLLKMGALASNGTQTLDIDVKEIIMENDNISYAIRIIDIPAEKYDAVITCTPYFVYEDAAGNPITVYGEEQSCSYNAAAASLT